LQGGLRELVDQSIRQGDNSRLDLIVKLIRDTGALQSSIDRAQSRANAALAALESLPASRWRDAMAALAAYSISRQH
jgi:octaprenyl-diphosphate synthase